MALSVNESPRDGPWIERRPAMAEKTAPVSPERVTQATTKPTTVGLDLLITVPERFCHRDTSELKDVSKYKDLADSIATEGLQTPIEYYLDDQGRPVVTKGHRRVAALRHNAAISKPGFSPDMEIEAIEVSGASQQDLIVRSISDNTNRLEFSQGERIRAAKMLHDNGVETRRAARALNVSDKTYLRLLVIARNEWMYLLVDTHSIPISYAPTLLDVAAAEKRLLELEEDLMKWVANKEKEIKETLKTKPLSSAAQLVKSYVNKPLVDHWVAQIKKKERLSPSVPQHNAVGLDLEGKKVVIKDLEIDLTKAPLSEIAGMVETFEDAKIAMVAFLKTRHAAESAMGPQAAVRETLKTKGGRQLLESEGLGDLTRKQDDLSEEDGDATDGN